MSPSRRTSAPRRRRLAPALAALLGSVFALVVVSVNPARAVEQQLAADAPEAWAMFFFTSATTFSGFGAPRTRELWSMEIFFDLASIPHLDAAQRTVGFDGTKEEDLNKSPLFGRPGVTIGLPWKLALSLGYVPPIKIFGVRANLFSFAIERPLVERGPWAVGLRLHGETGKVKGAYTCPSRSLRFEPGSGENPYGCEEESNDTAVQRYVGIELAGARRIEQLWNLEPYLTLGANYLSTEFHVHAETFGFSDRTRLASDTWTFSLGAGATIPVGEKIELALGVTYTPLWVTRPPETSEERDSLVQARAEITYRLR